MMMYARSAPPSRAARPRARLAISFRLRSRPRRTRNNPAPSRTATRVDRSGRIKFVLRLARRTTAPTGADSLFRRRIPSSPPVGIDDPLGHEERKGDDGKVVDHVLRVHHPLREVGEVL